MMKNSAFPLWSAHVTNPPHPTDKHVGSRVRMRRFMLDMS